MRLSLVISFLLIGILLNGQSIEDLDFLIGKWEVEETIYDGNEVEEVVLAERTCDYILNNTYIHCISRAKSGIEYMYLFNYNEKEMAFVVTGFFSHRSSLSRDRAYLEGKSIHLISEQGNRPYFHRSLISFADPDQLVWEGWTSHNDSDKEWKPGFREVARRAK